MGDHARLVTLEAVIQEIQQHKLLDLVTETGKVLLSGLQRLEVMGSVIKLFCNTRLVLAEALDPHLHVYNVMFHLSYMQSIYPQLIMNARGQGTFCAVDCPSVASRDALVSATRNKGTIYSSLSLS